MGCEWCDRSEEDHEGVACPDGLLQAVAKRVPAWAKTAVERLIHDRREGREPHDTNTNGGHATLQTLALSLLGDSVDLEENDDPLEVLQELVTDGVALAALFEGLESTLNGEEVDPRSHPYILAVRHLQMSAIQAHNTIEQLREQLAAQVAAPAEPEPPVAAPTALVALGVQPCPWCKGSAKVLDAPCPLCRDASGHSCGTVLVQAEEAGSQPAAG